jgi:hypothetical protein
MKRFRSSSEKDSPIADITEAVMDRKKDSNDIIKRLREVQKYVARLNASITETEKNQKQTT